MRGIFSAILLVFILSAAAATAQVPLGVLPFKGDGDVKRSEALLRDTLVREGGVTLLADSVMKEIIRRHEQAQSLGSAYHDISKLKVAEYLLEGKSEGKSIRLTVVDVNSGSIVFSGTLQSGEAPFRVKETARKIRRAIILHAASKKREVPEEISPYMNYLKNFVRSLSRGNAASYRYLAFYYRGKYRRPNPKNIKLVETAGRFLRVVRPNLVRSRLVYVDVKNKAPWVYISVVAVKLGNKTMHRFGIIELPDGSLGISIYEPDK